MSRRNREIADTLGATHLSPEELADEYRRARFHERENFARWQEAKSEAERTKAEYADLVSTITAIRAAAWDEGAFFVAQHLEKEGSWYKSNPHRPVVRIEVE